MPMKPKPYKLKCPKCNYSKVVNIQSDAINIMDMIKMSTTCPECKTEMQKVNLGALDALISSVFRR